jgi:hypothetical protein
VVYILDGVITKYVNHHKSMPDVPDSSGGAEINPFAGLIAGGKGGGGLMMKQVVNKQAIYF